jgi:hypothetical protein
MRHVVYCERLAAGWVCGAGGVVRRRRWRGPGAIFRLGKQDVLEFSDGGWNTRITR